MQNIKFHSVLLVQLLLVALILLQSGLVEAQKKSKKNKNSSITELSTQNQEAIVVTPEQRRKAEMYHIDAEKYYILEDYAKSFVLYQKSLEIDPGNATAYNKTAQIYLKNDDYEKALLNARKAMELDPTNKFFYITLAEIYSKNSDFDNAAKTYEQMIIQCPNTDEYLFEVAAIYVFQKNFTAALETYDRIEEKFGLNEEVVLQKQKLYLKQGMLDEAVAEGQKLIDTHPGDAKYKLILAEILISNDQPDKAITYLESVLEVDEQNPRALLILSDISRNSGDLERADKYLTQAFGNPDLNLNQKMQVMVGFMQKLPDENAEKLCIGLGEQIINAHPDQSDAYAINGDLMMNLRQSESAHEYYLKALKLGNSNYNIWQNIIQLEVTLELYEQAIVHGEKALELFPNQAALYWFIGSAYMADGQEEEAVVILEQGLKMTGTNNELKSFFLAQLGDAYNNLKDYKKSDESYEAALVIDPNNDHVLNNYSYFLALRKEKLDRANKMSSKLVEENPDDPTYLDTYAWVLYMQADYENARIFIEKAMQGEDISGTILEHYGDILFKLGEIDAAIVQWQKAKGLDETSDLIDKKIADRKLYE